MYKCEYTCGLIQDMHNYDLDNITKIMMCCSYTDNRQNIKHINLLLIRTTILVSLNDVCICNSRLGYHYDHLAGDYVIS